MKGITKITLNQETVIEAIQQYFVTKVFDSNQIAVVTHFKPLSEYEPLTYEATVDSTAKAETGREEGRK